MATATAGFWASTARVSLAILAKDFVAERRTKEVFNAMLIFGFMVVVIFSFAFEPTAEEARRITGGLVWLVFLFSATLGLARSFARETANECLQGLRLAPVDAGALYLGKLCANLAFMLLAELILVPLFGIFFNVSFWHAPGWTVAILFLGTWGLAALGTLFSAVSANTRMRELMLPVLLFPLSIPLLIAAVEATTTLLRGLPMSHAALWIKLLVGFDVIFTTLAWFVFEWVLEQ